MEILCYACGYSGSIGGLGELCPKCKGKGISGAELAKGADPGPFTPEVLDKIMVDVKAAPGPFASSGYVTFGNGQSFPVKEFQFQPTTDFSKGYQSLMNAIYGPKGDIAISMDGHTEIDRVLSGVMKIRTDDGVSDRSPIWSF